MDTVTINDIRGKLYIPPPNSHKGQNGKLLLIGGSKLFHAASLWALKIASRTVDMVYYASVPDNNQIVLAAKKEFHDGIVIRRNQIDDYIAEADCILIGPGLPREEGVEEGDDDTKELTERLLTDYREKRWVIDGGSLQVIDPSILPQNAIVTPHHREFKQLFEAQNSTLRLRSGQELKTQPFDSAQGKNSNLKTMTELVSELASLYECTIVLKGKEDIVCSPTECKIVEGGNSGMTKGGTGDVLAGLIAALYCKNDAFLAAIAGSFINKKAGEALFDRVGYYFNASDLVDEIPRVMKKLL